MANQDQGGYLGFFKGDIVVRKGRLCTITQIHFNTNPPSVTVKMHDNNTEVGTEFNRVSKPTDEDMLKLPLANNKKEKKDKKESINNPRKRSFFDAFFEERKDKFKNNKNNNNNNKNAPSTIASNVNDNRTFADLLIDNQPPTKKRKLSHPNQPNSAQGWFCSACTVENPSMDALKCYLCETPRTFAEKIRYPVIQPIDLKEFGENVDNNNNNNNDNIANDNGNNNIDNDIDVNTNNAVNNDDDDDNDDLVILKNDQKVDNINNDVNNNNNNNNKQIITYITWNVWFNQDMQVIERMQAIGDIITKNNADIVVLQEVTPFILDILRNGNWYKNGKYQSTILPSYGFFAGLKYFNCIITKHSFINDSITFQPFPNTSMGRHLIITPIKMNNSNRIIYASTTHLESPVGINQGGKADKFSSERKFQLKFSISTLNDNNICLNNNIIFGGDMNWCKPSKKYENDGDIYKYLDNNWVDCYSKLYPNKNGYTYDAKSNGMLYGWLQNRLDRILYKANGDLILKSIDMIGKDPIPNLHHIKSIKRKGAIQEKILPILPSDHYGLCARFELS